jgi:hypothetical protein
MNEIVDGGLSRNSFCVAHDNGSERELRVPVHLPYVRRGTLVKRERVVL